MKYEYLLFDADGTLLDFKKSEEYAFFDAVKKHNVTPTAELYKLYSATNDSLWKSLERGEIEKKDIIENRFKITFNKANLPYSREMGIEEDYQELLSRNSFVIDGVNEVLDNLLQFKKYIVTNGLFITQTRRIKDSGLFRYFEKSYISEKIGHQKPKKEYFDFVLNDLGINDRSKVLIIGDSYTSDIMGGFNAEIDTCWLNSEKLKPTDNRQPTYEITELKELLEILK